ncbi:2,3-diphosphoglycerate synthetase [Thermococcus sp.]|uniref:2,3-diphosphoglycerate synthetase n=1 Tax=Thermococcus sp. TaxID=35749 RepID=UPI002615553A|nr:2,3-diphosphoglycerate synthetase [Thermococcus sp.]
MRVVLIDGEHYPPVTRWAIEKLGEVCCAVFLGGEEKIGSLEALERELGVRLYRSPNPLEALDRAISENDVKEVVDLSDEPVVDYEMRFRIASLCMLRGVAYRGADFEFRPRELLKPSKPSIAVIGTGKRVGKTAVGSFVAKTLKERFRPVVVTMGRGGPERPELVDGERLTLTPEFLLEIARKGKHAASDHYEDALIAGVTTIGCRRCGGGMAGFPFFDVVSEGLKLAESLPHDIIVFEGSGATMPPVRAGGYITVVGANQRLEYVGNYFGPFRVALADVVVVTMADTVGRERLERLVETIRRINPPADVHLTAFEPRPLGDVSGRRVALFMTSEEALAKARERLEGLGAEVVFSSGNLARRSLLRRELESLKDVDAVLVELKAAAVDTVTAWAVDKNLEVIYLANEPVNIDGKNLSEAVLSLAERVVGE